MISLSDLEKETATKIVLYDDYLTIYDGDIQDVSYIDIIYHKYMGIHDFIFKSYSKALWDLINYGYNYIVEELEDRLQDFERAIINGI